MSRPQPAHHYADEIGPMRQAVPFSVDQRAEGLHVIRDMLLAGFAFFCLIVTLVLWLASGTYR